jgi:putative flippase GtrA
LCILGIIIAYFLSKIMPVIYQVAKFILVGGMNFLIDMGVLNFLIFYTGISAGLAQSGFKGISFLVATVNSYFWNKHWTFQRKTSEGLAREFLQFLAVSLIGFLINLGVDYVFVNMISPFGGMLANTWAQFGALMASIVALFWNFLGYKFIVFDSKKETISQTTV